jgi:RimJ/RimL family protein N-acetyltransferase
MQLLTDRLILRPWEGRDYEPMAAIQGDPHVRRFYPRALSPEELFADLDQARAKAAAAGFHFGAAEIRQTGELAGLLGIGMIPDATRAAIPSHPEVEIGWVLAQRFWGQGLAVEGARAWLAEAWRLGIGEIVAFTAAINQPSQRVMQKLGMTRRHTDDFAHPKLAVENPLSPHVVYAIRRETTA